VNGKRCLDWDPPALCFLYIQRFYCKRTGKTFSLLPDFLHPRKRYSQDIVSAALKRVLCKGEGVCEAASSLFIYHQTLRKWLRNFGKHRIPKAICFSSYGSLADVMDTEFHTYGKSFWRLLEKSFGTSGKPVLTDGTMLLWTGFGIPLY